MTVKEAILQSLEDMKGITNYKEVCNHIITKGYNPFVGSKTPSATVSAILGDFIRNGDSRVKRIKQKGGSYSYYLSKYEQSIDLDKESIESESYLTAKDSKYQERDLHLLLSSYLKTAGVYSKTIFHEKSKSSVDKNQIWTHPDMIGIKFLNLKSRVTKAFVQYTNRNDAFKLSSYELKSEINTDSNLKQAYFQAVSNSSWANYGYLVAFEYSDSLKEEMERLNQSFGIGIIELNADPFKTRVLHSAKYRSIDFKTIDKLCVNNENFLSFIEQVEKLMTAEEKYYKITEKEFHGICDRYLENDSEIIEYCKRCHIPCEEIEKEVVEL